MSKPSNGDFKLFMLGPAEINEFGKMEQEALRVIALFPHIEAYNRDVVIQFGFIIGGVPETFVTVMEWSVADAELLGLWLEAAVKEAHKMQAELEKPF